MSETGTIGEKRTFRRRLSGLNRMRQVLQTFARHGFSGFVDQLGLKDKGLITQKTEGKRVTARFGRRLRLAFEELGPTYVKLGQLLATREDMLPASMISELKNLEDNVRPFSPLEARKVIVTELGGPIEQFFETFDEKPLASASIGQVHRARTISGAEVVVKIRRPQIERVVEEDLDLLHRLAELLETQIPESRRYDPVGLIEEFSASLRGELDFAQEARSLEQMAQALGSTGRTPRVFPELSGTPVLTMEFLSGTPITKAKGLENREELAVKVVKSYVRQYLQAGLFHADPHPGNLLVLEDGSIAFLDCGAVGKVDYEMIRVILGLAAGLVSHDGAAMANSVLAMTRGAPEQDRGVFQKEAGDLLLSLFGRPLAETRLVDLLGELFSLTQRYNLRIRSEYFLLFRSGMILDGMLRQLSPNIDLARLCWGPVFKSLILRGWFVPALRIALRAARRRNRNLREKILPIEGPRRVLAVVIIAFLLGCLVTAVILSSGQSAHVADSQEERSIEE